MLPEMQYKAKNQDKGFLNSTPLLFCVASSLSSMHQICVPQPGNLRTGMDVLRSGLCYAWHAVSDRPFKGR
jgi:hypothetical protein